MSLRTPTGSMPMPAPSLVMNWVKPIGGCPAAWVKNASGVSGEHGSDLQVPACQPSAESAGSFCGAMMSPVSAAADAGPPTPAKQRQVIPAHRSFLAMSGRLPILPVIESA